MFRLMLFGLLLFALVGCVGPNELTQSQVDDGWVLLFDGETGDGWVGIGKDEFPASGWKIEDGVLTVNPAGEDPKKGGGDIATVGMYSDFEFRLEFRLTQRANSGIKYFVRAEDVKRGKGLGLEYQILDDEKHPDAKKGRDGNRTVASLYDLITADKGKAVKPIGQWNRARIVSNGKHVEHWLNGKKVLEYERGSKEFAGLIAMSKYKKKNGFGQAEKGHILLQDHSDLVSYRNIMIR